MSREDLGISWKIDVLRYIIYTNYELMEKLFEYIIYNFFMISIVYINIMYFIDLLCITFIHRILCHLFKIEKLTLIFNFLSYIDIKMHPSHNMP